MTKGDIVFGVVVVLGVMAFVILNQVGLLEFAAHTPATGTDRSRVEPPGGTPRGPGTEGGVTSTEAPRPLDIRDPWKDEKEPRRKARMENELEEQKIQLMRKQVEERRLAREIEKIERGEAEPETAPSPAVEEATPVAFDPGRNPTARLVAVICKESAQRGMVEIRLPSGTKSTRLVVPGDALGPEVTVQALAAGQMTISTGTGLRRVPINRWFPLPAPSLDLPDLDAAPETVQ